MDNATRHAQRLANNFLEDLDTMQRASRARDRRAMSHFETNMEEPVVRTSLPRRYPLTTTVRMGSVPPGAIPTYRSTTTNYRLPPAIPRTYYKTYRYVTESPYYLSTNSDRIVEPARPILSSHYSVAPSPLTQRYTYYYPSPMTSKLYTGSMSSLTPEVNAERRRIERRMDDLLEYKLPPPEYYREMRGSLRGLNQKLDEHRKLLDRYSGIDMNAAPSSVEDRIESKFQQLASRMPELNGYRSHGPGIRTSPLETQIYYDSPKTTLGYGSGLVQPTGSQTSELRGRIKRLLCRAKRDPHYYRFMPSEVSS